MPEPNAPDDAAPATPAAYAAVFADLLQKVPGTITEVESNFFTSLIDAATAQRTGADYESGAVLDGVLFGVRLSLPAIMAGQVKGYGALRLRYLLEQSHTLAGKVAELDTRVVTAAGTSTTKGITLKQSQDDRIAALRVLKNLTGRDEAAKARRRKATKSDEKPDERARSLGAIAEELLSVVAQTPARIAVDAGATPELMERLRVYAKAVLDAQTAAKEGRSDIQSLYDTMNLLDGQILHDLGALQGAMRDARRTNKELPRVRIPVLRRGRKKKAQAQGQVQQPPQDAAKAPPQEPTQSPQ